MILEEIPLDKRENKTAKVGVESSVFCKQKELLKAIVTLQMKPKLHVCLFVFYIHMCVTLSKKSRVKAIH